MKDNLEAAIIGLVEDVVLVANDTTLYGPDASRACREFLRKWDKVRGSDWFYNYQRKDEAWLK